MGSRLGLMDQFIKVSGRQIVLLAVDDSCTTMEISTSVNGSKVWLVVTELSITVEAVPFTRDSGHLIFKMVMESNLGPRVLPSKVAFEMVKEGWGCYHWVDGSVYEGTWLDNVIHGTGAYFGEDGRKSFHGEWRESVIHGVGHYQWCKGREYCGQYKNDRKYGFGIFRWPDGRKYEGFWKDGKQYGRGRYTSKEGMVIELEESHRDEPKEFELNWTSEKQVTNHPWADRGGTAQDEQGVR